VRQARLSLPTCICRNCLLEARISQVFAELARAGARYAKRVYWYMFHMWAKRFFPVAHGLIENLDVVREGVVVHDRRKME